jgi:uncharacterized protein (DUF305 family)
MPSTIRISQFFLNVVSPTLLVYSEISQLLHNQHGSNAINEAQDKQREFSAASRRVPRLTPSPFNLSSLAESAKRGTCFFFLPYFAILAVSACTIFFSTPTKAQQTTAPAIVEPGAPGQPTKTLPPSTKGTLPPLSPADVGFMQGMIMHHSQAVEMTALIQSHTDNKNLRLLGAKISRSQSDEINFMQRWLAARGEPVTMPMPDTPGMDMSHQSMALMPGMLSPEQMDALRKAKGPEFDRLFLAGMIQHHNGALIMVKDLFDTAGAGQDATLFDFATDVDSGQRAEIRIMQSLLQKESSEEK